MNTGVYLTAALSLFLMASCSNKQDQEDNSQELALSKEMLQKLEFANAEYKPVVNELRTFGKITTDPDKSVDVFPAIGGSVSQVNAQLGDYVQKGQVLAVLQSTEVAQYRKDLLDAKAGLLQAQKNLQVTTDMFNDKLATEKEVISAKNDVENSQNEIERINELYKIYNLGSNTAYYIKSPISGFITAKNISPNMLVRSDASESLFSVAQINSVWVMANISESNISQVNVGCEADIQTLSYPDKIIKGKVDRVFNVIDPETKSMQARIQLENSGYTLKPEMNATVTLKINENREMLSIPSKAVIFSNDKNYVLIYHSSKNIEEREVEVYHQNKDTAFIQSGLKPEEKVICQNALLVYRALTGN